MANASHKGMGAKGDGSGAMTDGTETLGEADIASDIMGSNRLQGTGQDGRHNQRQIDPDAKLTPDDGPLQSADMLDKDARAEAELNTGGGVHPGAKQGMKQGGVS